VKSWSIPGNLLQKGLRGVTSGMLGLAPRSQCQTYLRLPFPAVEMRRNSTPDRSILDLSKQTGKLRTLCSDLWHRVGIGVTRALQVKCIEHKKAAPKACSARSKLNSISPRLHEHSAPPKMLRFSPRPQLRRDRRLSQAQTSIHSTRAKQH
jgi:hypothetical protein